MAKTRKRYTEEFRLHALERMRGSGNVAGLSRELRVPRSVLYRWQAELAGAEAQAEVCLRRLEEENRQLKQLLAERELEVDFFKGALQKIAARRQASTESGGTASTARCGK